MEGKCSHVVSSMAHGALVWNIHSLTCQTCVSHVADMSLMMSPCETCVSHARHVSLMLVRHIVLLKCNCAPPPWSECVARPPR